MSTSETAKTTDCNLVIYVIPENIHQNCSNLRTYIYFRRTIFITIYLSYTSQVKSPIRVLYNDLIPSHAIAQISFIMYLHNHLNSQNLLNHHLTIKTHPDYFQKKNRKQNFLISHIRVQKFCLKAWVGKGWACSS